MKSDDNSAVVSKRSSMTLFSDSCSHYSHRVRIVLAEKGVTVDLIESENGIAPNELADFNPYNTTMQYKGPKNVESHSSQSSF